MNWRLSLTISSLALLVFSIFVKITFALSLDKKGDVVSSKDFITGWLKNGKVSGRPSAPLFRNDGSLLLSDDKANVIYLITYKD